MMGSVLRSFNLSSTFSSPPGTIYLWDGKTRCRDVVCRDGVLVKDILDEVCNCQLPLIPPVARPLFALCDTKTGFCLSPYQTLTPSEARRQYQLRLFVNTGNNGMHLQRMSRTVHNIYWQQLKDEFIHAKLYPPVSINTAVWMAAIDMAGEANAKNKRLEDLIQNQSDVLKFMPATMKKRWRKDKQMQDQLRSTFERFCGIVDLTEHPDYFVGKYLEVYEKDEMCGTHIFRLKPPTPLERMHKGPEDLYVVVVSSRHGIYRMKGRDPKDNKDALCSIKSVQSVSVDLEAFTAVITKKDEGAPLDPKRLTLNFTQRAEIVAFAVVVNTYYQLLVDANTIILEGGLKPPERCLRVGESDGLKADLCHAPITPSAVQQVLEGFNMVEGHFLVRESRSSDNAFTLSLCHNHEILSFRIVKQRDGTLSFVNPRNQELDDVDEDREQREAFHTLDALIRWHLHTKSVLPTCLKQNCCPKITGGLPLLSLNWTHDEDPRTNSLSSTQTSPPPPSTCTSTSPHSTPSPSSSPSPPSTPSEDMRSPIRIEMEAVGVNWIEYGQLKIDKELGKGHFSDVYLATLSPDSKKVAVKVPSMQLSNVQAVTNDLKREIETMARLDHPNIVRLLGITETQHFLTKIGSILMVVMEFVEGGSLRGYLEKVKHYLPQHRELVKRNIPIYLKYARQIAEGMQYLEETKVVHRDLATRNVLVVSENLIKISDFGLARQRFEDKDYYQGKNAKDLPIYWYAPECLEKLKFTHKSDVWSYGVTLWEIFTFGELPTPYLQRQTVNMKSAAQVFQTLVRYYFSGERLPRIPVCPTEVYDIILKCWAYHPAERPTFNDLSTQINLATLSIT